MLHSESKLSTAERFSSSFCNLGESQIAASSIDWEMPSYSIAFPLIIEKHCHGVVCRSLELNLVIWCGKIYYYCDIRKDIFLLKFTQKIASGNLGLGNELAISLSLCEAKRNVIFKHWNNVEREAKWNPSLGSYRLFSQQKICYS